MCSSDLFETLQEHRSEALALTREMMPTTYLRQGLLRGLEQEAKLGANPFKFGFAGSTDVHNSLTAIEEDIPTPKASEVRVKVLAAGVSLPDVLAREGVHGRVPAAKDATVRQRLAQHWIEVEITKLNNWRTLTRDGTGTELARGREQVAELDRLVALDARHRRFARHVAFGEAVDHHLLEAALVVEHVVRDAEPIGNLAGVKYVLARTAGAGLSRGDTLVVDLLLLRLRLPPGEAFDFLPGQYLDLIAPGGLRRSYSIANPPSNDGVNIWRLPMPPRERRSANGRAPKHAPAGLRSAAVRPSRRYRPPVARQAR